MPGVGVMGASVDVPERPLLRSHKALPRRGIVVPQIDLIQPSSPESNGTVTAAPFPPLTPPGANQEESMGEERTPRNINSSRSENQSTGILTPRRLSKPPTPDVTPPRTTSIKRPNLNHSVHLSSSSRADSFQTACESISSDGDMETPVRSRSQSASQNAKKRVPSTNRQNARNGVSAKLKYKKETPPSASQPLSETEYETGFESFDGEWMSNKTDASPTPLVAEKRKPSKSRSVPKHKTTKTSTDTLDVLHLDESLMREKNLRDRVQTMHQVAESPSMERFREDIGWPSNDEPSHVDEAESRRLSGVSSTSTVEAMIIDSPKRAHRSLRHTEKRSSLRSASSPITRSERASTASNTDSQHRLIHKAARISEQDRRSISSDVSFSTKTTTSAPPIPADIIPVVVIPERRSSLKSGPNSYASSKPDSQRSSRRPPPVSSDGSMNAPRQRPRTMSDSVSAKSRDKDSRGRIVGRPVVPPRSSSLSAPTSRNNSRATSLTSESLRSHTLAMDLEIQKRRDQQPVSPPRHNILGPNGYGKTLLEPPNLPDIMVSSTDDMATLRPPSLPYTQWSIPSSSPGPIEIREATAVSLFPHNNRSLLLVDQRVPQDQRGFGMLNRGLPAREANPRTPDNPIPIGEIFVESPLKNPRPPPKPPVSKPLPPLPTHDMTADATTGGLVRRWTSVRRTWSARPRSDSFNTITRSLSMRSAKNRKAGIEMDSRLHPFWRPRGFWDDVPGSPKKEKSAIHTPAEPGFVSNSLGLPQQRLIFEGPPALNRRSPEMKRFFNGLSSSAHYHVSRGSLVDNGGILRTGSPLYQNRYRTLSRWGMRWRSLSLRSVRAQIRRVRQRREERKRAARRETLKQSIGGPVYVVSSATNGVVG
ncbi:hypothetical protein PMG11_02101 [Penicillium brasilianum]|uniref:Uncharacterized protein n=1 Tax=Penicillium brasilianum TaxID=104259 RepID=A0A0F7TH59_PENBI|nr:hypothetical protein PMG11_02101 [Penicillium brasilianum]